MNKQTAFNKDIKLFLVHLPLHGKLQKTHWNLLIALSKCWHLTNPTGWFSLFVSHVWNVMQTFKHWQWVPILSLSGNANWTHASMERDVRRPSSKDLVSHFTFIPSGNHSIQEVFKIGLQVRNKADFVAFIVENQFSIMTLKYQNSNTPETFSLCTMNTTDR